MKKQDYPANPSTPANALERIAQGIIIAHAWVAGPAMSEQERTRRELVRAESQRPRGAGVTG